MKVALIYASHHGHTREICERLAEGLRGRGLSSEIRNVEDLSEDFELDGYDAVILAGSVHYGRHPRVLARFASEHRGELDALPTAFVSVSLASADAKGASEAHDMALRFSDRTGWHPTITMPIAGALQYSKYNPLLKLVMRQVSRVGGGVTDTKHDHVYTDWEQVDALAARVGESLHGRPYEGPEGQPWSDS
jgi:menaquinone-dependent protoporphyrinogen oxidase